MHTDKKQNEYLPGTLFVVATPIGNLGDITMRALEVLRLADLVLCEDTRVTRKLLSAYDISAKTMRYDAHSTVGDNAKILAMLEEGKYVALVSDAGTPSISDPGVHLVRQIRDLTSCDIHVVPIPGASAFVTALSASGVPASEFLFLGFLPHKKGRETLFREIAETERAVVFYESTHRIEKAVASLGEHIGSRTITIARELTKHFEEIYEGTADEILAGFSAKPERLKGEFVVIVHGK